jgi:hypothetical protein
MVCQLASLAWCKPLFPNDNRSGYYGSNEDFHQLIKFSLPPTRSTKLCEAKLYQLIQMLSCIRQEGLKQETAQLEASTK